MTRHKPKKSPWAGAFDGPKEDRAMAALQEHIKALRGLYKTARDMAIHDPDEPSWQGYAAALAAAIDAMVFSIGAVEVVRCRECSRRYAKDFGQCCPARVGPVRPDGYCDEGQRGEDGAV